MTGSTNTGIIRMAAPDFGTDEVEAVTRVIRSGHIAQGEQVELFEGEFASRLGAAHAVAVSSGTAALHVALLAHGVASGSSVVTSPFSFVASANAIIMAGARPLFADIGADDFNLRADSAAQALSEDTGAILAVHLYGQPADLAALRQLAAEREVTLIEDACQAHGARYGGTEIGSSGTACFSFYPTKNMATGEGGMVVTEDGDVAARARMIRSHGAARRYRHEILGYNYRMTDIAAALGRVQLARLDDFNARRRANAAALTEGLEDIEGIDAPRELAGRHHVFHQYAIRVKEEFGLQREELIEALAERGIETDIHYPLPITRQPFYEQMRDWPAFPEAERAADEVLSLPVHPGLSEKDMQRIAEAIRRAGS